MTYLDRHRILTESDRKQRMLFWGDSFAFEPFRLINLFFPCKDAKLLKPNLYPSADIHIYSVFTLQDGEIDLKLLTNVLSPETEVFEVGRSDFVHFLNIFVTIKVKSSEPSDR